MWSDIAMVVEHALHHHKTWQPTTIDDVLAADADGRRLAQEALVA